MKRKVIGIGESVTDIIFKDDQPTAAVVGGSSFNALISLGRCGLPAYFVGEVGDDRLGLRTRRFMNENGVDDTFVTTRRGSRSQLSLAFLNERQDAEYLFYKDHAGDEFPSTLPEVAEGDVILFGSYYALNPSIHTALSAFLHQARQRGAILYYDINFRGSHIASRDEVRPSLLDNLKVATVVRGSSEDFQNFFSTQDAEVVYRDHISPSCPLLICTRGGQPATLRTPNLTADYPTTQMKPVSTVGAGDNFNAGFIYGLLREGIDASTLAEANHFIWNKLFRPALLFSSEVCGSFDNYISPATGNLFRQQLLKSQI